MRDNKILIDCIELLNSKQEELRKRSLVKDDLKSTKREIYHRFGSLLRFHLSSNKKSFEEDNELVSIVTFMLSRNF